ncbi:hypothetical protein SAMD00019534_123620 [Acytostelium subglobosum LB1]|uniref:hypothetical protein n=1 Tax=Acytostelium subglobosum LB1 TaxID=1410327 RepID=UPI00064489C1|nr:hypothetical protein SAMD00019534_123620 [Acytostelium subglobosum LB1]GAM29186.1 hypothetical protein SAMD00019534_123620 [Acytostelium subglobosum LB1]|eukprot:XP_012747877.1 hypothetical protein SAMD00019534_123620 [Acytostelium subglobosum LB1]
MQAEHSNGSNGAGGTVAGTGGAAATASCLSPTQTSEVDPQPTMENISQALVALYKSTDEKMRNYAQTWLMQVQRLPVAWEFCPKLILESNVVELQYFGASTLENKLKSEWSHLPDDMKKRVLAIVVGVVSESGAKLTGIVAKRMCVVLSITAMHTYGTALWSSPIENIIQMCSPSIEHPLANMRVEMLPFVLEFLSILPEELCSYVLPCNQFKALKGSIASFIDHIYRYLLEIAANHQHLPLAEHKLQIHVPKMVIRAQGLWQRFMLPTSASLLLDTFNMALAMTIADPSLLESLTRLVENSLGHLSSKLRDDIEAAYSAIADRLQCVMPEFYAKAIKEDDSNSAKAICNCLVQVMLANNSTLLTPPLIKRYFELLISIISLGNLEVCDLLFPLLDDFKSHPEYLMLEPALLESIFLSIMKRFRQISMYPCKKRGHADICQIHQFRSNSIEMLASIQQFALSRDSTYFIKHLIEQLKNDLQNNELEWQHYEVTLSYISTLSEGMSSSDSTQMVPILLHLIPTIPVKSLELFKTSIKLIGKFSNYLHMDKSALEKVIADLISALASMELLPAAAQSLLNIAINRKCQLKLAPIIKAILDMSTPHLMAHQSHPAIVTVYQALIYIIHVIPDADSMMVPFQQLLKPIIENVNKTINTPGSSLPLLKIQLQIYEKITGIIDVDDINDDIQKHPLFPFFHTIIPQLKELLKLYPSECEVIESIASIYRGALLYCRSAVSDFVNEILGQATEAYTKYPQPQLLQVVSAVNTGSKPTPDVEIKLRDAIGVISATTITLLKNETACLPPLKDYPIEPQYHLNFSIRSDITKDYFHLIQNSLKSTPNCVDPNIITALSTYIIHNILDVNDVTTSRHCLSLLSSILLLKNGNMDNNNLQQQLQQQQQQQQSNPFEEAVATVIKNHGKQLIGNLLVGLSTVFPASIIPNVAELLQAYGTAFPTVFRKEAAGILINSTFLEGVVDHNDKQVFLSQIQHVNENKVDYRFYVQAFSKLCRGTQG